MLFRDAGCLVSQLPQETLESCSSLDLFFAMVLVHRIHHAVGNVVEGQRVTVLFSLW